MPNLATDRLDSARRLRRVDYERLVDAGDLADQKVELIDGFVVRMSPQGARHAAAVQRLTQLLVVALAVPGHAAVRVQLPLALGDDSEPEPDLAAVPPGTYRDGHPQHALLVIEVADTSLAENRRRKVALYARGGVSECWIVDVVSERVEVHSRVVGSAYERTMTYGRGDLIASTVFEALRIGVADLFD